VGRVRLPKPAASSRSATPAGRASLSSVSNAAAAAASSAWRSRRRRSVASASASAVASAGRPNPGLVLSRRTDSAAAAMRRPRSSSARRCAELRTVPFSCVISRAKVARASRIESRSASITAIASAASAARSSRPPASAATARSSRSPMRDNVASRRLPSASSCAIATARARFARSMPAAESRICWSRIRSALRSVNSSSARKVAPRINVTSVLNMVVSAAMNIVHEARHSASVNVVQEVF
jgi:hypothetical protein